MCYQYQLLQFVGHHQDRGNLLTTWIKKRIKKSGYKFSQFGTEPSSYLFGFDKMFPSGYGIDLNGNIYKQILTYNKLLSSIEKDSEIMILGTQSQTIPYSLII